MVQRGANVEGKAILYVSMFGHVDIVEFLKSQGMDKKPLKIRGINTENIATITAYVKSIKNNFRIK